MPNVDAANICYNTLRIAAADAGTGRDRTAL
jgi:hypothetical protein